MNGHCPPEGARTSIVAMTITAPSLSHRLAQTAHRCFVGRAAELQIFERALAAPLPPFAVLWIHGPGGVGKSALLAALRDRAIAGGRRVVRVDGASIERGPQGVRRCARPGATRCARRPGRCC